ncbi:Interleukin-1 receptor-associated kinase 4 [Strongyloides ratti]|uniref:non-specific serine/threonine protein kinase n=1 Tax=Strongyloides ratti TaxID=34506 RepID=A0A090L050_STRRB|nr:Interleukin-1 receptor-associated kinase 4 [Strongyloides ratti]CEF60849.1 Interleukin-1 receptor-associated kinase 4 [Strongyloides ratti]
MTNEKYNYIYEIPSSVIWELSNLLDSGNIWKQLALHAPTITYRDVEACTKYGITGSPTEAIMRILGSKGYTISDLYKILARGGFIECMKHLKDYVPKELHVLDKLHIERNDNNKTESTRNIEAFLPKLSGSIIPINISITGKNCIDKDLYNFKDVSVSIKSSIENTLTVNYQELLIATENFSDTQILGKGGYGIVYRGCWKHIDVAVKRIMPRKQSLGRKKENEKFTQSFQELKTLTKYRHDNILPLYGFSMDGPEPCLVYQYMANGSVEDRLLCRNNTDPLTWEQRFSIAKGIVRALNFLHSIPKNAIIHRDVKTANILLSQFMEPKLGDFGLSRDVYGENNDSVTSPLIVSHIKGTMAYLPPEYINNRIISTKLDVYSFGIVLLELATGLRPYSETQTPHGLIDYVLHHKKILSHNNVYVSEFLVDRRLQTTECFDIFNKLLYVGLLCGERNIDKRPEIDVVSRELLE